MDELEDMGLAEEEEEKEEQEEGAVSVKSEAMTIFKKHKGTSTDHSWPLVFLFFNPLLFSTYFEISKFSCFS